MAMKKNISKALAMAVMMSVLAGGSAYAAEQAILIQGKKVTTEQGTDKVARIFLENDKKQEAIIWPSFIRFHSTDPADKSEAHYAHDYIRLTNSDGKETLYIDNNGLLGTAGDADIGGNLTVNGTITADTSGAIASGDTGLVNGGTVYTALQDKADAATTLAGYGITDGATKTELEGKADKATTLAGYGITDGATKTELEGKADKATTLAGYGITDGATKTELQGKADKATTLAGYGITDGATKTELEGKADKATTLAGYGITDGATKTELDAETTARKDADADLQKQIDAIGGGSSAGLNELNNKINQTNDRVDRVGATAAALAGINYQPMAKGQSQVAVGMGGYKGKKATALGLAYQFNDRVSGSVAGAANGSERMFNVGFNYLFGQHSDKDIAQMAAAPGSVSLKEAELQAQVDSLNNKVAQLEAMVKALAAK